MRIRVRALLPWVFASIAVVAVAVTLGGSAGAVTPTTVTIGSTTGNPTMNVGVCSLGITCTFVPFTNVDAPALVVPANGTITSFSLNGPSGAAVQLRVMQPGTGGNFTGAGTSPMETLTTSGVNTFTVSMPVQAGDVLGLDNATSALLFDDTPTMPPAVVGFYELPPLADNQTAIPNRIQDGFKLPLSATIQESPVTTTSSTSTGTTTTVTTTVTKTTSSGSPAGKPPVISSVGESNTSWRESGRPAKHKAPIGTTFSFKLNEPARVILSFFEQLAGRSVQGGCAAPTSHNRRDPGCTRDVATGSLSLTERAGTDKVAFRGRTSNGHELKPGNYLVLISAANSANQLSNAALLAFTASSK